MALPPDVGIFESPVHTICINAAWWSHISGAVTQLLQRDSWGGTESEVDAALQSIYELLSVGLPTTECEGTVIYPQHASLWHDESHVVTGGDLVTVALSDAPFSIPNAFYNTVTYQDSFSDGDSFGQPLLLDAGEYTFYALGARNTAHGLIDWYLDDSLTPFISGQDWYNSSPEANVTQSGALTLPTAGLHTITGVLNGKNPSSLAYAMALAKFWFTRDI